MLITNQTAQDYYFGPLHLVGGIGQTLTVDDTTATSLYLTDDGVADAINTLYAALKITVSGAALPFPRPTGTPEVLHGDGSPEGLVYAGQGSLFMVRTAAGVNNYLYTKTTGLHLNTGWMAINPSGSPSGTIDMYGGSAAPSGYFICDGSAVSRTTYSALFTAIGVAYGAGDGSTTFNIPDLRGRVAVGLGTHADVSTLGNNDGSALASRRPKHKHTKNGSASLSGAPGISDPGHTHAPKNSGGSNNSYVVYDNANSGANGGTDPSGGSGTRWGYGAGANNTTTGSATTGITANAGTLAVSDTITVGPQTGAEPTDAPAYVVVNYIIKQ